MGSDGYGNLKLANYYRNEYRSETLMAGIYGVGIDMVYGDDSYIINSGYSSIVDTIVFGQYGTITYQADELYHAVNSFETEFQNFLDENPYDIPVTTWEVISMQKRRHPDRISTIQNSRILIMYSLVDVSGSFSMNPNNKWISSSYIEEVIYN